MSDRTPADLLAEAREGSRAALARLITYVEHGGDRHRDTVALAYASPVPYVVGITGPPGAGKSTLTNALVARALEAGTFEGAHPFSKVAVLAIDPTSPFTGGAVLGDRVRMQSHSLDKRVYIRSMATRGQLGGLSQAVPDAIRVLGAAGFELVFVETVGVGQMEVEIASAADTTLVVSIPGAGDAMQASKAGLLEIADVFVINKADRPDAHHVRRDLEAMLDFVETSDWRPPIIETVALEARGVSMLWTSIAEHRRYLEESGHLTTQRERRAQVELERVMTSLLLDRLRGRATGDDFAGAVARILAGETDPYCAAESLLP